MLFVYELLRRRCIAPQQSDDITVLEIDGSNTVQLGFLPKVLVPEGFEVPLYFFHVKRGQVTVLDQEGIELASSTQAEEEAVRRAQHCLADDACKGTRVNRGMIIVADENWRRLFELPF